MRRGTIHTVLVLLTSQSVGRVPASEGQADHHHAHDEHDDGGEDRDEDLRLEPGLDPLGQFLVLIHVARERGDGSYNHEDYLYGGLGPRAPRTPRLWR